MFRRAEKLIGSAGMTYGNVVLTRIYLTRILAWYDAFNAVRTPEYERLGLLGEDASFRLPASTGIQGKISEDCEVFMDLLAICKGDPGTCPFETLHNPLQNEATAYGSSFARGVAVDVPGARYVLISGTASIDESGVTVHLDDPRAQIRRTMDNFKAILSAGGAGLDDLYHAVWYCKRAEYAPVLHEELSAAGWPHFPWAIVEADVCRADLLVEIDGAAVVSR
jgi:enamine deaminase RidA (YjgF/YER057c/UK114 family)